MRNRDFKANTLPPAVQVAAKSVLQLKASDRPGSPAVVIRGGWVLTAQHVLVDPKFTRAMLAIFNDERPSARDVFALDLGKGSEGWRAHPRQTRHSIYGLDKPQTLEFAACRLAPNVEGRKATARYGAVQTSERLPNALSPPGSGGVDPNLVYMISFEPKSTTKVWSSGLLHQVGGTSFSHSVEGADAGDSGAPILDIDGRLIGIHVAGGDGVAIACRADVIKEKLQLLLPETANAA